MNKQLTFLDLFSGIGGFRIGLERAGFKSIGYCDCDEHANKLYKSFFDTSEELFFNDIRNIQTDELPDFDILCAGFPCQSFSIAGKRRGFEDTRGTMFFEVARILKDKRPRYFILENVKGLLNHDGGKTFQTILKILSNLGYQTQWQLLNSKFFGVPQNRERVYIVGYYGTECARKIFPITGTGGKNSCEISIKQIPETRQNSQRKRIYTVDGISPCITASHGNQIAFINKPRYDKYKEANIVETLTVAGDTPLIKFRNGIKQKNDIATYSDIDNSRLRRLTPLECFRLQGFPDEMVSVAKSLGLADIHLYKMAGNAVTVNVVEAVARKLANAVNNKDTK